MHVHIFAYPQPAEIYVLSADEMLLCDGSRLCSSSDRRLNAVGLCGDLLAFYRYLTEVQTIVVCTLKGSEWANIR